MLVLKSRESFPAAGTEREKERERYTIDGEKVREESLALKFLIYTKLSKSRVFYEMVTIWRAVITWQHI